MTKHETASARLAPTHRSNAFIAAGFAAYGVVQTAMYSRDAVALAVSNHSALGSAVATTVIFGFCTLGMMIASAAFAVAHIVEKNR